MVGENFDFYLPQMARNALICPLCLEKILISIFLKMARNALRFSFYKQPHFFGSAWSCLTLLPISALMLFSWLFIFYDFCHSL